MRAGLRALAGDQPVLCARGPAGAPTLASPGFMTGPGAAPGRSMVTVACEGSIGWMSLGERTTGAPTCSAYRSRRRVGLRQTLLGLATNLEAERPRKVHYRCFYHYGSCP
jgi:hypothetical protein